MGCSKSRSQEDGHDVEAADPAARPSEEDNRPGEEDNRPSEEATPREEDNRPSEEREEDNRAESQDGQDMERGLELQDAEQEQEQAFYAHLTSMLNECDVAELDDWSHLLLQWELLTLLGDQRVAAQSSALNILLQPSSKDMLEILLSSGDCGPQAGGGASYRSTDPWVVAARWRAALSVLSRVLASDLLARGSSWRYRLAVAVALTFCHEDLPLTLMATGKPIDPCQRYHDFAAWAESGELHASFVDQSAWAMRYVVGTWCASEELEWARTHADADKSDRKSLASAGHRMVRYRDTNDNGESVQGAHFYGGRPVTLEEMHCTGGVCGAVSKFTTGICQAFGILCMPVAQPGHCAYIWQATSGKWTLGNACTGWSESTRHADVQISWGDEAWLVCFMQKAQADFQSFSRSERLPAVALLAGSRDGPGAATVADLLRLATQACPHNFAAWLDRVKCLGDGLKNNTRPDAAPWVGRTWTDVCNAANRQEDIVSRFKPVRASVMERAQNVVDGTASEWWTSDETAWLEIDLQELCFITQLRVQWWGESTSDTFRVLSSGDGADFTEQRTHSDAGPLSDAYNGWVAVPGWETQTSRVRLELSNGHLDPWGMNKLFGIRQILISGEVSRHSGVKRAGVEQECNSLSSADTISA